MKKCCIINVILFCVIFAFHSCEDNSPKQSSLITVTGGIETRFSSGDGENPNHVAPVVFTGNDIAWFNSETREIKFRKNFNPGDLKLYQNLQFHLASSHLFTVVTFVMPIHSFTSDDLVLYLDSSGKCYLHDCYPLSLMETLPEVKQNKQNRETGWNKFINQLKNEKKLNK